MSWIATGVAVVGSGIKMYASNQQLRKQDDLAAAGIRRQGMLRDQANADVSKTITDRAVNNDANLAANRTAEQQAYGAALQRALPVQGGAVNPVPGSSKRYAADVLASRADVGKFGQDLAGRTAAIDAPQLTNLQTQLAMGDTATKLGLLHDTSSNEENVNNMQVKAIQANPWLMTAGELMQAGGTAAAGNRFGAKKPPVAGANAGIENAAANPSVYDYSGIGQ